jgi:hypothetical protein
MRQTPSHDCPSGRPRAGSNRNANRRIRARPAAEEMTCIGFVRCPGGGERWLVAPVVVLTAGRLGGLLSSNALLRWTSMVTELEEVPMSIVGGLDIHRKQLTFDYVDQDTRPVGGVPL